MNEYSAIYSAQIDEHSADYCSTAKQKEQPPRQFIRPRHTGIPCTLPGMKRDLALFTLIS